MLADSWRTAHVMPFRTFVEPEPCLVRRILQSGDRKACALGDSCRHSPGSTKRPAVKPRKWCRSVVNELDRVLTRFQDCCSSVRELILSFKDSYRDSFPNWRKARHNR